MRYAIGTWGQWTVLGLVLGCSGNLNGFGHNEIGGADTAGFGTGGAAATGGGGPSTGGAPAAGAPSTGGQSGATPYPDDPTLPIDPSCTCGASDNICNGSNQCVPRCDEGGLCARWLANQPVVDMFARMVTAADRECGKIETRSSQADRLNAAIPAGSKPTVPSDPIKTPSSTSLYPSHRCYCRRGWQ
jgi:hypothetical protein